MVVLTADVGVVGSNVPEPTGPDAVPVGKWPVPVGSRGLRPVPVPMGPGLVAVPKKPREPELVASRAKLEEKGYGGSEWLLQRGLSKPRPWTVEYLVSFNVRWCRGPGRGMLRHRRR